MSTQRRACRPRRRPRRPEAAVGRNGLAVNDNSGSQTILGTPHDAVARSLLMEAAYVRVPRCACNGCDHVRRVRDGTRRKHGRSQRKDLREYRPARKPSGQEKGLRDSRGVGGKTATRSGGCRTGAEADCRTVPDHAVRTERRPNPMLKHAIIGTLLSFSLSAGALAEEAGFRQAGGAEPQRRRSERADMREHHAHRFPPRDKEILRHEGGVGGSQATGSRGLGRCPEKPLHDHQDVRHRAGRLLIEGGAHACWRNYACCTGDGWSFDGIRETGRAQP